MAFPKMLFVIERQDRDGKYLLHFREQADAVEDSDTGVVATYQLVKKERLMVEKNVKPRK